MHEGAMEQRTTKEYKGRETGRQTGLLMSKISGTMKQGKRNSCLWLQMRLENQSRLPPVPAKLLLLEHRHAHILHWLAMAAFAP